MSEFINEGLVTSKVKCAFIVLKSFKRIEFIVNFIYTPTISL